MNCPRCGHAFLQGVWMRTTNENGALCHLVCPGPEQLMHTAWPSPASGEVAGLGQADPIGGRRNRRAPGAPSSPGLCDTCQSTGWVPSWDPQLESYALVRCPDCPPEDT